MPNQNVSNVVLVPMGDNQSNQWEVKHDGVGSSNPAHYPTVHVPNKAGPFLLHFTIDGQGTGVNDVTFAATNPISVKAGAKGTGLDPQIVAVVASADGKELFVVDSNHGKPSTLYYTINANGHGPVDPIIDNGGSNISHYFTTLSLVIGTAVLAFVVGIAFQRLFLAKGR